MFVKEAIRKVKEYNGYTSREDAFRFLIMEKLEEEYDTAATILYNRELLKEIFKEYDED